MELLKQAVKRRGLNIEVQLCDNPSPSHKIIFCIDNPAPSHLPTILNPSPCHGEAQASTPPNHAVQQNPSTRIAGGGDLERHNRLPDVDRLARAQVHNWIQQLLIVKFKIFFSGATLVSTLAHFQIQKIFSGAGLG